MREIDRGRLRQALQAEEERFVATHRRSRELFERGKAHPARRRPDAVDDGVGRARSPSSSPSAEGARFTDVDGSEYVDLCLGDTGGDDRARADGDGRGHRRAGGAGHHADAAHRGLDLGRRRDGAPVRAPLLAVRAHRDRRQPVHDPARPRDHGPTEDPGLLTTATTAPSTRPSRSSATARPGSRPDNIGPPVDPALTTVRDRVQRRRGARGGARARGRRLRARRAGDDQHRHRPARARLPRRAPRADARARHVPGDRRDAHASAPGPAATPRAHGLEPDFLTIGKPLASGVPAACYGMSEEVAERIAGEHATLPRHRRRRDRRHPVGQRALARRDAGDARARPHRRGVRAHDRARRALRAGVSRRSSTPTTCPGT